MAETTENQSPTAKLLGKQTGKKATYKAAPATTKKAAGTKAPATKAKEPEVLGKDLITDASQHIEMLTKETALAEIKTLIDDTEFNQFKIGGVLSIIQANGWWEGQGHESFKDFMETEYGMAYRKGMYLIGIYNGLVESGVPWEKVKEVGWTKLKELAGLLTLENVDMWVGKAKELSTTQLIEYIKQYNTSGGGEPGATAGQAAASSVSTMTFKLHADQRDTVNQALEKAMKDNNTDVQTVALEFICMQYLEGALGKQTKGKVGLKTMMVNSTPEEVMGVFEQVFPDLNVTIEVPDSEED